ncbi:MAG: TlpA disulfide reductase family protein [Candidatus Omnitrophota bacterium]
MKTIAVILLSAIFLATGCQQAPALDEEPAEQAPSFTLTDINGNSFDSSGLKGKVVILDFWATWCPPCREEIPHFVELDKQYNDKGLAVVGISLDEGGASAVKSFAQENGISYPILIGTQEVQSAYGGIRGIPTTFIIDRNGNIVQKVVGYRDKDFFEEAIKDLL